MSSLQVECHHFDAPLYRGGEQTDDSYLQASGGKGLAVWKGGGRKWWRLVLNKSRRSSIATICTALLVDKYPNSSVCHHFVATLYI